MGLDIRVPLGLIFLITGGLMSIYGAITREPYSRGDLKKTEPACYQWLAGLFDGGRPRA